MNVAIFCLSQPERSDTAMQRASRPQRAGVNALDNFQPAAREIDGETGNQNVVALQSPV